MRFLFLSLFFSIGLPLQAQTQLPLYPGTIPNSTSYAMKEVSLDQNGQFLGYRNVAIPLLEIYLPDVQVSTGAAVVICPGGGYGMLSYRMEGRAIAEAFRRKGIAAFIVKYRLPSDSIMPDKAIGPLQDAQQALKTVRMRAKEWNVDTAKVGIMGFSAGGHLASTAATHFSQSYIENGEKTNLRPDFAILVYPVVSMEDGFTHGGSRRNLLGESPSEEQVKRFSNHLQVTSDTPPTWITHTGTDRVVPVDNSILFYQALIRNKVPAEMHLYPVGDHGFVLNLPPDEWMTSIYQWMQKLRFIP